MCTNALTFTTTSKRNRFFDTKTSKTMKKISNLLTLTFALAFTPLSFSSDDNTQALRHLAKVSGMYEQIDKQKQALKQQSAQAAHQIINQISMQFPHMPQEYNEFSKAQTVILLEGISDLIDTEKAVATYVNLASDKFSNDELQQVIAFYESEAGQNFVKTNTALTGEWTTIMAKDMNQQVMLNLQDFSQKIKAKAIEVINQSKLSE